MKFKFLLFSFVGFLSTYVGEIKAEEICYYSTPKEHRKCKKGELKSVPKYPIENFHSDFYVMGKGIPSIDFMAVGSVYQIFEFKAYEKEKLQISSGTKSIGLNGLNRSRPWINKKTFTINPEHIIYLNKSDNFIRGWPRSFVVRKYSFKYIDEYGVVDSIKFQQTLIYSNKEKQVNDLIGDYLLHISNLKWGEEITAESKIEKILKENEKFLTITKSIIFKDENLQSKCFIAKDGKFPQLSKKYEKIYLTINPLRAKLDLPPSSDLKPICN